MLPTDPQPAQRGPVTLTVSPSGLDSSAARSAFTLSLTSRVLSTGRNIWSAWPSADGIGGDEASPNPSVPTNESTVWERKVESAGSRPPGRSATMMAGTKRVSVKLS